MSLIASVIVIAPQQAQRGTQKGGKEGWKEGWESGAGGGRGKGVWRESQLPKKDGESGKKREERGRDGGVEWDSWSYQSGVVGEEYASSCQSSGLKIALRFESPDGVCACPKREYPKPLSSLCYYCPHPSTHPFIWPSQPLFSHHFLSSGSKQHISSLPVTKTYTQVVWNTVVVSGTGY